MSWRKIVPQGPKGEKGDPGPSVDISGLATKRELDVRLKPIIGLSDASVDIYVDSQNGNDVDGDGSFENPYKTIQQAFNSIPKIIDKRHTVFCAPGVYDEEPFLTGIIGGAIFLRSYGNVPDVETGIACRVRSLGFYDVMGYVHIEDFAPINEAFNRRAFILFSRCIYGSISRCRFDSNTLLTTKRMIEWDGSFGSIGSSFIDSQYNAIYSINGSTVRVDSNIVTGSTPSNYALYAKNGFIFKAGKVTWINNASVPEYEVDGGKIYGDSSQEWNYISLQNGWATASGIDLRYKRQGDMVFLYGWVNKSPFDNTVIGVLPAGYRPINTQRNPVSVVGTSSIQTSLPILSVSLNGNINLVNIGNVPSNTGIAINNWFPIK